MVERIGLVERGEAFNELNKFKHSLNSAKHHEGEVKRHNSREGHNCHGVVYSLLSHLEKYQHSQIKDGEIYFDSQILQGSVQGQLVPRQKGHDRKARQRSHAHPMSARKQRESKREGQESNLPGRVPGDPPLSKFPSQQFIQL